MSIPSILLFSAIAAAPAGEQAAMADYNVIPLPRHIEVPGNDYFVLDGRTKIVRGEGVSEKDADFLSEYIRQSTGIECHVTGQARKNAIWLSVSASCGQNPDGYTVTVD